MHKQSDSLVAINKDQMERFFKLIAESQGIENVPNEETVDAIRLHYNEEKNAYDIQTTKTFNVKINELDYTWIQFPYGK
jgi:threonine synthase